MLLIKKWRWDFEVNPPYESWRRYTGRRQRPWKQIRLMYRLGWLITRVQVYQYISPTSLHPLLKSNEQKTHICLERQKSLKHIPPSLTRAPLANCTLRGLSHFSDAPSFSRNCTLCLFSSVELHRRRFASSFASIYNTNNVTCEPLSLWAPLLSENSGAKCHNYRKWWNFWLIW